MHRTIVRTTAKAASHCSLALFLACSLTWEPPPVWAQTPAEADGTAKPAASGKSAATAPKSAQPGPPSRATLLRGEYGPYRANNDLLYYHLDVRVDPEKQTISGKNTIRFRMLKDDNRIQLDLNAVAGRRQDRSGRCPARVREGSRRGIRDVPGDA